MRDRELVLAYLVAPERAVGVLSNIAQFNYRGNHVRSGEVNVFSRRAEAERAELIYCG
ncbi:hypothetical protein AB1287_17420 [Enterobacter asburiae]|uniref:hypothetical protein n=1 Tax=Scandinavium sp. UTDF21-P1B TaxID=3446379 RepID=UPI0034763E21